MDAECVPATTANGLESLLEGFKPGKEDGRPPYTVF